MATRLREENEGEELLHHVLHVLLQAHGELPDDDDICYGLLELCCRCSRQASSKQLFCEGGRQESAAERICVRVSVSVTQLQSKTSKSL